MDDGCLSFCVQNLFNHKMLSGRKGVYWQWCICADTTNTSTIYRPQTTCKCQKHGFGGPVSAHIGGQTELRYTVSASSIRYPWSGMNLGTLTYNSLTDWKSNSECIIASVYWPHCGHTGDAKVKAASPVAVQHAIACIVHNSKLILDISAL
jgi:hypothetical protein